MRLLLIVLGSRACWFRQEAGRWSSPFVEAVGRPDANGVSASQCPWLGQPAQGSGGQSATQSGVPAGRPSVVASRVLVELVLDSGFQDVELQLLAQRSSSVSSWLDCRAVRQRVLHDRPGSSVDLVCLPSRRKAISIVQTMPPHELQAWLLGLNEVMFTSVSTVGELLARRYRKPAVHAKKACLYVLHDAGACRHLLYLSGRLCFARLVPALDESAVLAAVGDTIDHLQAIGVDTQGLMLGTLGLSVDAQQRLAVASRCAGQSSLDSPVGHAPAMPLADWLAAVSDTGGSLSSMCLAMMEPSLSTLVGRLQALLPPSANDSSEHGPPTQDRPSGDPPADDAVMQSLVRVPFHRLLYPWRTLLQATGRLGLSMAGALLLGAALWLTGTAAADRWQEHRAGREQLRQLREQIVRLRGEAGKLHVSPVAAERSLLRRQAFAAATAWQPRHWLGALAAATTAHEPIVIDSLEWSRQVEATVSTHRPASGQTGASRGFDRTGHWRHRLPAANASGEQVLIHLRGHLDAGLPLREQRDQLAAFVSTLESLQGADAVQIDRSPIDDYAGGRRPLSGEAALQASGTAEFGIRLLLQVNGAMVAARPAT